ncbi:hypothetical protein A2630_02415 [Candidatus Woesebacteria bacterium RIFCSPHIGHO2_01_FULL_44_10]|uniref:Glycosyltransferase 2-like domain-containing protein n=1 Tax=Candidatus Woesebacteria bacterium RIFCSPLOWO2_01_FULL_44_14 TaxID=1802525 RepID=A0A1F8C0R4_9BACT|nr:MAG: hypothetical protein A2630_02415 [Candidatus Woesebacteria bacterium RIFCSPHIGHO2_01_FULL_44_10]OGM53983.1 MAG: hypothetical protein A3F62_00235 [Candidatus Woesebacteria bacterium RIFCSPHIGHO2_12_FULL_44_11]OGM69951.1 MAG: hypothetical protein A2975_05075 [Candidatus Woesebacteria bacterium RIFCSPLOWO2_01_FULL_44_14]
MSISKPKVSIIIVNYNTKNLTLRCVESVVESRPGIPYKIIVVDNGSTEKLEESSSYKLMENKENIGLSKTVNQGIKVAKGEYILLLNSDTRVQKNTIDKLVEFGQSHIDAGVVVPQLLNPDGSTQASAYLLPTVWLAFCPKKLEKFVPKTDTVPAAVMAAYLITPAALKKVGGLNEKYFLYFEDLDYAREVKKAGLKIYYLPTAQVIHKHGASGGVTQQLVAAAKLYHGFLGYYLFTFILWSGQKIKRILGT